MRPRLIAAQSHRRYTPGSQWLIHDGATALSGQLVTVVRFVYPLVIVKGEQGRESMLTAAYMDKNSEPWDGNESPQALGKETSR